MQTVLTFSIREKISNHMLLPLITWLLDSWRYFCFKLSNLIFWSISATKWTLIYSSLPDVSWNFSDSWDSKTNFHLLIQVSTFPDTVRCLTLEIRLDRLLWLPQNWFKEWKEIGCVKVEDLQACVVQPF